MFVHHTEGTGPRGDLGEGECPVGSLSEIQKAVVAFKQEVRQWYEQRGPRKSAFIYFRGQADAKNRLIPSVGRRLCSTSASVTDEDGLEFSAAAREKSLLENLLAGLRSLCIQQRQPASLSGSTAPFNDLFAALGSSNDLNRIPDKWQLPLLALCQHYELPTRLLDWSESVDVGTYFAVVGEETKRGALYMFHDRTGASVFGGARVFPMGTMKYVRPFRVWNDIQKKYRDEWQYIIEFDDAGRMAAQKAVLTVQRCITKPMEEQLEEAIENDQHNWTHQRLQRLLIPADRKKHIQDELAQKHITRETLYGDVNVTRHLGMFGEVCRRVATGGR